MGPTFVKLGQMLSTRPDIISCEYIEEFKTLQDQVPAFASKAAVEVVENQLGGSIASFFQNFNTTPVASASIGQVHLAESNGKRVAVKIQRPGIREVFQLDLDVLRSIVCLLEWVLPKVDGVAFDWKNIFNEYVDIMYRELDYRLEGLNGIKFKYNFRDVPWIKIPHVLKFLKPISYF